MREVISIHIGQAGKYPQRERTIFIAWTHSTGIDW